MGMDWKSAVIFGFVVMGSANGLAAGKKIKSPAPAATEESKASSPSIESSPVADAAPVAREESGSAPSRGSGKSPFAANPSPFGELLDQTSLPTLPAAIALRATRPVFAATYETISGSYKTKIGDIGIKDQLDATNLGFEAIYPTPVGLRVGGFYNQVDVKIKETGDAGDSTVKQPVSEKGILLAGAFRNGAGFGLALIDVEEKATGSDDRISVSVDEHYGFLLPSFYWAGSSTELIVTYQRSMRHKTGTRDGYFDLHLEQDFGGYNGVAQIRNHRNSENSDTKRDNFEGLVGVRIFLEEKSNILASLAFEDPSNSAPNTAGPFTVANETLTVSTDYWVAPEHVVGGMLSYLMADGRGSESSAGERAKFTGNTLGFGVSYSFRM